MITKINYIIFLICKIKIFFYPENLAKSEKICYNFNDNDCFH